MYDTRQSASAGPLVLYASLNRTSPDGIRVGLSVSRRIGSAVVRNRWKRRLREAFRQVRATLPAGNDFVIVVRSGAPPAGASGARQVEETIRDLATRVVARPGYAAAANAESHASGRQPAAGQPPRRRR